MTITDLRASAVLTVDLDAIADNYRMLAATVRPAQCAAVVKADAYGLGLDSVAPCLAGAGARVFFVAQIEEALSLRALLPDVEIAVLGGISARWAREARERRILPVLNTLTDVLVWRDVARDLGRPVAAYLHADTGMNRLGLPATDIDRLAEDPDLTDAFRWRALISHFACADEVGHPLTDIQIDRFRSIRARLPHMPASLCNSSGIFRCAHAHHDLVRPGYALYGGNPTPERDNPMRPVVRLQARVLQVRSIDSGEPVGYGATHRTNGPSRIATLAVGYADGFLRSFGNRGRVRFGHHEAPVVGRISMDLTTVDVTHVPEALVQPDGFATLIGPDYDIDAAAAAAGTIGYELLTLLGRRYARRYQGTAP